MLYNPPEEVTKFTKKQTDVVMLLLAEALESIDINEDVLDSLEHTAFGAYLDTLDENALAHYGVLGMKWGVRRSTRKVNKLERQTRRLEKSYERGNDINRSKLAARSRLYRKYSYRTTKRIRKITKYLQRDADGGMTVSNRILKVKHKPEEIARAKQYLSDSEILRERYRDVGAKLDSLKLDALLKR